MNVGGAITLALSPQQRFNQVTGFGLVGFVGLAVVRLVFAVGTMSAVVRGGLAVGTMSAVGRGGFFVFAVCTLLRRFSGFCRFGRGLRLGRFGRFCGLVFSGGGRVGTLGARPLCMSHGGSSQHGDDDGEDFLHGEMC